MMNEDNELEEDNYDDWEEALNRHKPSEKAVKAVKNLANFYMSQRQLANKGSLLWHYKSGRLLKTYIDIYERAVVGKVEVRGSKKTEDVQWGYACLAEAIVEKGVLYLVMNDEKIYRLRNLKEAEIVAYMINSQKVKSENEGVE